MRQFRAPRRQGTAERSRHGPRGSRGSKDSIRSMRSRRRELWRRDAPADQTCGYTVIWYVVSRAWFREIDHLTGHGNGDTDGTDDADDADDIGRGPLEVGEEEFKGSLRRGA
ncbi:hypothetical protein E4U43_002593 [Claviceps pusilla]|uniref:Uncharacterized protein n=1 Tax=Claviceps pusilla TaxID=123648 RepID=A0A9P7N860_9HYPO|nr:hypothetical protein E4U43_002593 [Claviceps pusilla]